MLSGPLATLPVHITSRISLEGRGLAWATSLGPSGSKPCYPDLLHCFLGGPLVHGVKLESGRAWSDCEGTGSPTSSRPLLPMHRAERPQGAPEEVVLPWPSATSRNPFLLVARSLGIKVETGPDPTPENSEASSPVERSPLGLRSLRRGFFPEVTLLHHSIRT